MTRVRRSALVSVALVFLMASQVALGFGLRPGTARRDVRFRVGQYNILAANLANNLKSWFWYGYSGIKEATDRTKSQSEAPSYRDDGLDNVRVQVFGYGRSAVLAEFWSAILKKYVKIWSLFFPYELQQPSHYEEGDHGLSHSELLVRKVRDALLDFLYRDSPDLAPEGDKDLAHHLFISPSVKKTRNFALWQQVAGRVDLGLLDLPAGKWELLEAKRLAIDEIRQRDTEEAVGDPSLDSGQTVSDGSRWDFIEDFNRTLRCFLAGLFDLDASEEHVREILESKCLRLAQLIAFSDKDMKDILKIQHESFDWQQRVQAIVSEIAKRGCSAWGISELDNYDDISRALQENPNTSNLKLVAFKHRKTLRADDGVAIYADDGEFEVEGLGYVRFSSAASYRADSQRRQKLRLRVHEGRVADGIIAPETEYYKTFIPVVESEGSSKADDEVARMLREGAPVGYTFTDKLNPEQGKWFDERVATFVVLRSKNEEEYGAPARILLAATHLWHTQNNSMAEQLRLIETTQMMQALSHFKSCAKGVFGHFQAEVVCGDFNDAPNFAWYEGREETADADSSEIPRTPVVEYMTKSEGFLDTLAQVDGHRVPTTYTMARSYPIDYIFVRRAEQDESDAESCFSLEVKADDVQQISLAGRCGSSGALDLLPYGDVKGAVTGTPMPAVGTQDIVPSDHVPVSATIRSSCRSEAKRQRRRRF